MYKASLREDPNLINNYYNLGNSYAELNKRKLAIDNYLIAIKKGYKETRIFYNIGYYYAKWEDYDNSVKYYEIAYKQSPKSYNILLNLSLSYKKNNRLTDTKKLLYKALQTYPGNEKFLQLLDNTNQLIQWHEENNVRYK